MSSSVAAEKAERERETFPLAEVPNRITDVKERPYEKEYRGRHVGYEALATIAKRALVGLSRLRDSKELVIYDTKPIPEGEYEIIPLSLIKNPNGTGDLLVTEVGTEFLYQADLVISAAGTTVPISPDLSITNFAKYMFLQNQGSNPIYVCVDGLYDPVKGTTTKATTPAAGVGMLLQGSGILTVEHLMKANPRLISPSGNQTVNVVMTR